MTPPLSDGDLFERLRAVIRRGWIDIPDEPGYGGTGAPGKLLEYLLGVDGSNLDIPDAGRWELKYHGGGSSPITLFHKEPEPRGYLDALIEYHGWIGKRNGLPSFRHLIWGGPSRRGFYVEEAAGSVFVRNKRENGSIDWARWAEDDLIAAFLAKARRLLVVRGVKDNGRVRYDSAERFENPRSTSFVDEVVSGRVAIDFDAYLRASGSIRNHGTKFRVKIDDVSRLYRKAAGM